MEIKVYPQRGHLLRVNGKLYKLKTEGGDGRTVKEQSYIEIEEADYQNLVKQLAGDIAKYSDLKLEDVLADALKDLPLDRMMELMDELEKLKTKSEKVKSISTYRGCIELKIGSKFFVIRE